MKRPGHREAKTQRMGRKEREGLVLAADLLRLCSGMAEGPQGITGSTRLGRGGWVHRGASTPKAG